MSVSLEFVTALLNLRRTLSPAIRRAAGISWIGSFLKEVLGRAAPAATTHLPHHVSVSQFEDYMLQMNTCRTGQPIESYRTASLPCHERSEGVVDAQNRRQSHYPKKVKRDDKNATVNLNDQPGFVRCHIERGKGDVSLGGTFGANKCLDLNTRCKGLIDKAGQIRSNNQKDGIPTRRYTAAPSSMNTAPPE